jgi:hypothetical protein
LIAVLSASVVVSLVSCGGGVAIAPTLTPTPTPVPLECTGFVEQPSYPPADCLARPAGTVCVALGFSPDESFYIWLIDEAAWMSAECCPQVPIYECFGHWVYVNGGNKWQYHHVDRTNLVKRLPAAANCKCP